MWGLLSGPPWPREATLRASSKGGGHGSFWTVHEPEAHGRCPVQLDKYPFPSLCSCSRGRAAGPSLKRVKDPRDWLRPRPFHADALVSPGPSRLSRGVRGLGTA